MKNDDPLRPIEEWTGHRAASLIPTAAAVLLLIAVGGFVLIAYYADVLAPAGEKTPTTKTDV